MNVKTSLRRFDRGELQKPVTMPNGWLKVDGYIGKTGFLEYRNADGTKRIEYRPPEEAFHADALASFRSVPLTNDHPREGFLHAENTKEHQVGTVELPTQDGDKMRASILVTDAKTIADLENGKQELSCGYLCDVDETPGEVNGHRYDAIQRNVRGNHVALVAAGRAGPEVRVRMDNSEMELLPSEAQMTTKKIKIDSVEFEVSETIQQAFDKHEAAQAAELASAKKALETEKARGDAAEASVKKLQEDAKTLPEKIRADIAARVELESTAQKILGDAAKFDGKTDAQIKSEVALKVLGLKTDGKSDDYVNGLFSAAVKQHADAAPAPVVKDIEHADEDDAAPSIESLKAKFAEASRNAHITRKEK